jgi:hypothetical protein
LAAPQGFEPRYADPESAVLPLNEGAVFATANRLAPAFLILWSQANNGQPEPGQRTRNESAAS